MQAHTQSSDFYQLDTWNFGFSVLSFKPWDDSNMHPELNHWHKGVNRQVRFLKIYIYFMCMCVLCLCVCVHQGYAVPTTARRE